MLGPEQQRLDHLERHIPPRAEAVSAVLPEAVADAGERRRQELAIALEPSVTMAVRSVARHEPDLFGEILSPTIGAAVRKAVADALAALLERFNRALEESLSLRSIRWRIEARRTKRPFAEVVLLRTLAYRVEQVLLIHSQTGLLLQHVVAEGVPVRDPDQVAAMLEAIDAFAREAFRPQPSTVHLSRIRVGDLMVWVDRDDALAVAAAVRGVAPPAFGELLREVRERIYLAHREALLDRADVRPDEFADAVPLLARCLQAQRREPPRRAQRVLLVLAIAAAAALAVVLVLTHARGVERARLLRSYADTLQAQPGIVVTSVQHEDGRAHIRGFRDVLAAPADELLARRGLPPADVRLEPFYSLDPAIVERRARQALKAPPSVALSLRDGTLSAAGSAPRSFVQRARLLAPTLPGVERYDDRALRSEEALASVRAAAAALEKVQLPFARGSVALTARAELARARDLARASIAAARAARTEVCITAVGYTDPMGTASANVRLSARRAAQVVAALRAAGLAPDSLRAYGAGVRRAAKAARAARLVTFRVDVGSSCTAER